MNITGKDLKKWGLPAGPVYKVALETIGRLGMNKETARRAIVALAGSPASYLDDDDWAKAARLLVPAEDKNPRMKEKGCPIKIFGQHMIEQGALNQIYTASKLPVSVQAALMPDGHQGYGLPIGGVLATDNVVIPYAVGVDIGCRMHMTVTDMPASKMKGMSGALKNALVDNTVFGAGQEINGRVEHSIMDDERFDIKAIKPFKHTAEKQLGTSGGGNHFVEFGSFEAKGLGVAEPVVAILSHSGSRGFGSNVAKVYTKIAMDKCKLPKEAKHLAWLSLDDEDGQEYWEAMNVAGEYAQACHEVIHSRILKALKLSAVETIQNHHNFAWKETLPTCEDVIVHRKGATPAHLADVGIIPGSMTTPTYVVTGKGYPDALSSSSHGAGRLMSRAAAKQSFTMSQMKKDLAEQGVELIGGSLDECSMAYKDIDLVMGQQAALVEIQGRFLPFMVRMAGEQTKSWEKK